MEKREVAWQHNFEGFSKALGSGGLLLVSVDEQGRPNAMTIGWALLGIVWRRPMCVVLVRPSRYSYQCLETTEDFTVNVPPEELAEAVQFCGSHSGRDCDKFAACGLEARPGVSVRSPGIEQALATYECRVVYKSDVTPEALWGEITGEMYSSGDFHRVYYGQITGCYGEAQRW